MVIIQSAWNKVATQGSTELILNHWSIYHTRLFSCSSAGGWKTIWDREPSVGLCLYICFMCTCAYLAATVCANTCLSMGVSVWLALCLLAIMSSTLVVRGIPVIASIPWASSPCSIPDSGVTAKMATASWLAQHSGIPHQEIQLYIHWNIT